MLVKKKELTTFYLVIFSISSLIIPQDSQSISENVYRKLKSASLQLDLHFS